MATIIFDRNQNQEIFKLPNTQYNTVIGTTADDYVFAERYSNADLKLLGGNDVVQLDYWFSELSVRVDGTNAIFTDIYNNEVTVSVNTTGVEIQNRNQDSLTLKISNGQIVLGNQVLTSSATTINHTDSVYTQIITESEQNGSISTADSGDIGNTIIGEINDSGDQDYYQLNAVSGGVVEFRFTHPDGIDIENELSDQMDILLLDQNGSTVLSFDSVYKSENFEATIDKAGSYYLVIADDDSSGYQTGTYQVDMSFSSQAIAYDGANNDSTSTAIQTLANGSSSITFDDSIQGVLGYTGDSDYFRIEATSGGVVNFNFTHPDGIDIENELSDQMDILLLDQNGSTVLSLDSVYKSENFEATIDEAGSYYFMIADDNGSVYQTGPYQVDMTFIA